jgi:hypothetical protein
MRVPRTLDFVDPPERGLSQELSEWERKVVARFSGDTAYSGFVTLAQHCTHHQAEALRRRVHRGNGPWRGGSAVWCVSVRKVSNHAPGRPPEWEVYVRRADTAEVAAQ